MSLTLGRQGGIAQPLKKQTVGQINIAHVVVKLMMARLQ